MQNEIEMLDGELYLADNTPPPITSLGDLKDDDDRSFEFVVPENKLTGETVYERAIFKYKDPTSPPHIKKECAKWFKPGLGAKICVGWTIRHRWLYRIGIIRVVSISEAEAKNALEDCLKQSAVAAAIAAVVSGGSAAAAAAKVVLSACLTTKLGDKLISLSVEIKTSRGDWE